MKHIHFDPLGGAAGDMVIAGLLHAFPEFATSTLDLASRISGCLCATEPWRDHALAGLRFSAIPQDYGEHAHHHGTSHHAGHDHAHVTWRIIRGRITAAALPAAVQQHAIGIFAVLAAAEGEVHGVAPDDVAFHEVGAADSIADILAVAWLIDQIGPASWSCAPLPLGSGRVQTAHGVLPIPAPATALLLKGFATIDDGVPGERVTPTGAAILNYLQCTPARSGIGTLTRSGFGFGTRRLPGLSNCLRVLVFESNTAALKPGHRELSVIAFEVDDQSPEDLAAGLDRLRQHPAIYDAIQMPAYGKKGRLTAHIQILAQQDAVDSVTQACFHETTTIGLRMHAVQGMALPRIMQTLDIEGRSVRVKQVERPGGTTRKAESDDLLGVSGQAERTRLRRVAEEGQAR